MAGDTVDLRTAKDALGALANRAKPESVESPRRPSGVETDPVVEDLEVEPAEWSDLQGYGDPARLGMSHRVIQGFAKAKKALLLDLLVELKAGILGKDVDCDAGP